MGGLLPSGFVKLNGNREFQREASRRTLFALGRCHRASGVALASPDRRAVSSVLSLEVNLEVQFRPIPLEVTFRPAICAKFCRFATPVRRPRGLRSACQLREQVCRSKSRIAALPAERTF